MKYILITFLISLSIISNAQVDSVSYRIYSTYLAKYEGFSVVQSVVEEKNSIKVIDDTIRYILVNKYTNFEKKIFEKIGKNMHSLKSETIDDFFRNNEKPRTLEEYFQVKDKKVKLVDLKSMVPSNNEEEWKNFWDKNYSSIGVFIFGAIGYSKDRKQALLYEQIQLGSRSNCGYYVYEFIDEQWKLISSFGTRDI